MLQAIVIRWLSLINLLENIGSSFLQIKVALNRQKEQHQVSCINQYLVKQTVRLLRSSQSVTQMIQSGSCPTLYLVLPCTLSLRKTLDSWGELLQYFSKHESKEISDGLKDEQDDEGTYTNYELCDFII